MKKKIILSIFIFLGIVCITGCSFGGGDDSSKYDININSDDNIETKAYVSSDKKQLIVYMTNNYSYNIASIEVTATYYDKEGNKIDEEDTTLMHIQKGIDVATYLDLPEDEDYNGYVPERTEVKVSIDEEYQTVVDDIKMFNDKVSSEYKVNGDKVTITLKNNAGVDLVEVSGTVLFMKKNKPVYAEEIGNFKITKGATESETIDVPIDWSKSDDEDVPIDFDSIKVLIGRASDEY